MKQIRKENPNFTPKQAFDQLAVWHENEAIRIKMKEYIAQNRERIEQEGIVAAAEKKKEDDRRDIIRWGSLEQRDQYYRTKKEEKDALQPEWDASDKREKEKAVAKFKASEEKKKTAREAIIEEERKKGEKERTARKAEKRATPGHINNFISSIQPSKRLYDNYQMFNTASDLSTGINFDDLTN